MPDIQTNAELIFYDEIGLITRSELIEMGAGADSDLLSMEPAERSKYLPAYNLDRDARLSNLFNGFKNEIDKNIIILPTPEQKKELLDSYLERAIEHRNQWEIDYNKYLHTWRVQYVLVSTTHNQLHYIKKLIKFIFQHNEQIAVKLNTSLSILSVNKNNLIDSRVINRRHALTLINPSVLATFEERESKATNENTPFDSAIRCAAFCELLLEKNYLPKSRTRVITLNSFAKLRYGIDITRALAPSKKQERNDHKTKTKNKLSPLNAAFK